MKPRERVTAALSHKEPDRIPIDFGGGVSSIMRRAYINLCNFLNVDHKDTKYTIFDTVMDIDERILESSTLISEERARDLSENSSYAAVLGMSLDGVFESGTYLFGFEDFLIKL